MALLDRMLSSRIRRGVLAIHRPNGGVSTFGVSTREWPEVTLRIHAPSAERRILTNPGLGLGECYMDGSVSVDGDDIMGLIALVRDNNVWEHGGQIQEPKPLQRALAMALRPLQQLNSLASSRANVAHHYDLSNDFYKLWLDPDMQYSCAYWADGVETLEQAQAAKMAHIAAKLALAPGQRVLDIGCGWGGMALYLNRIAGVEVLGITLSEEQLNWARARAETEGVSDKVRFELLDYRVLAGRAPGYFDRIVSVGMFEHVGVPQFDAYFRACINLLKEDGVMLLHTIGRMGSPSATDKFTRKYIFPGGYIPALSETLKSSEKMRFIHSDIENLRLHYAKTLRAWYDRVRSHEAAITAQYDARFYRMWLFYLAGATAAFEAGGMCNYQIQYIRNRHALPITRDYIVAAERDLMERGGV
jgi:cyclopropane-fatty-acyl-phospholipid synthase